MSRMPWIPHMGQRYSSSPSANMRSHRTHWRASTLPIPDHLRSWPLGGPRTVGGHGNYADRWSAVAYHLSRSPGGSSANRRSVMDEKAQRYLERNHAAAM